MPVYDFFLYVGTKVNMCITHCQNIMQKGELYEKMKYVILKNRKKIGNYRELWVLCWEEWLWGNLIIYGGRTNYYLTDEHAYLTDGNVLSTDEHADLTNAHIQSTDIFSFFFASYIFLLFFFEASWASPRPNNPYHLTSQIWDIKFENPTFQVGCYPLN